MTVAAIVVQNLLYVVGAAVGIVVGGLVVTLRHRRPTSVEAHVVSFHRGLQALAPSPGPGPTVRAATVRAPMVPARTVHVVGPLPMPADGAPAGGPLVTEAETV